MIIDFHTHVGDFRQDDDTKRQPVTWEGLIARLDDEGIDKAVLLPICVTPENVIGPEIIRGAGFTLREQVLTAQKYPDRIIPFGNLDARWLGNSAKTDFSVLLDWFQAHGCKGIGEITSNLPYDDERVLNMFRQIGDHGMPALIHGVGFGKGTYGLQDEPGAPRLGLLLRETPQTVVVGHGQGFWSEMAAGLTEAEKMSYPKGPIKEEGALPRLMRKYPNLWGDISAGSGFNAITRDPGYGLHFLNEFQDKIVFGTDVCFGGPEDRMPHLKHLKNLLADGKISSVVYEKITNGNARRLLGM